MLFLGLSTALDCKTDTKQDGHIQMKKKDYATTDYSIEDQSNTSIIFTLPIEMDQKLDYSE